MTDEAPAPEPAGGPPAGARELPTRDDTVSLGVELGSALRAGDVVILDGPLGAGKTALTAGIAEGLGVQGRVTSPTFVLARRHRPGEAGSPGLVHVDAYRLLGTDDEPATADVLLDELEALDLDSALSTDVVVVEWGAGLAEVLTEAPLVVELSRRPDSEVRSATWSRAAGTDAGIDA